MTITDTPVRPTGRFYKLDPFYRDEKGRFIEKPTRRPEPLSLVPAERVIGKGGVDKATAALLPSWWAVRVVWHTEQHAWRVHFVKVSR